MLTIFPDNTSSSLYIITEMSQRCNNESQQNFCRLRLTSCCRDLPYHLICKPLCPTTSRGACHVIPGRKTDNWCKQCERRGKGFHTANYVISCPSWSIVFHLASLEIIVANSDWHVLQQRPSMRQITNALMTVLVLDVRFSSCCSLHINGLTVWTVI